MRSIAQEGSSARNFDALTQVIAYAPEKVMSALTTTTMAGHIDGMVRQESRKASCVESADSGMREFR